MKRTLIVYLMFLIFCQTFLSAQNWKPAGDRIKTRWADDVTPEKVLPEYPRPQMQRTEWKNLNGLWQYAITSTHSKRPATWDGQILVPFCIESALSGVGKKVHSGQLLWYRRTFTIPESWDKQRILLHFGAVDWETAVFVNGHKVGFHQGAYDAFSCDITHTLKSGQENTLVLSVWDPTNEGNQARGKQVSKPGGIWYTAVTGIWQTVWLEPVPETRIVRFTASPDIYEETLRISVKNTYVQAEDVLDIEVTDGDKTVALKSGDPCSHFIIKIPDPELWSPESPHLYDLTLTLSRNGTVLDRVHSYFGMRKISTKKNSTNIPRLMLNNKVLFQLGTLDQGWWPDGLYTAPTDEALAYDILKTKELGFNAIRKHVKVEPARWYYHCDRLGILVWQDMPNGDMQGIRAANGERERKAQSVHQYKTELRSIMDQHINSPSIVIWVPFNEGWGQFNTFEICNWISHYDPSRLVDGPSGWIDFPGAGHIQDIHKYPGPDMPAYKEDNRALVLGEFGGLGLPLEDHIWQEKENWGYRYYKSWEKLQEAYIKLIDQIPDLIEKGLSAAIYTQTTDVEIEVNGLITYDRDVIKMDVETIQKKNKSLY